MNLKNCVTKSKDQKYYTPHKLRSHPLRCITLPVCVVFLFILFWFIICPLIFVGLMEKQNNWPKIWPYYYWAVALLIFIILLSILVCLWRCTKKDDLNKRESDSLLNTKKKQNELCTISLNTIQKSQDKLDVIPSHNEKKQQNYAVNNVPKLEEKLVKPVYENENLAKDSIFRRCSVPTCHEIARTYLDHLTLPTVEETKVEVHSPSSPLTPRELFFWDLIENANRSRNSGIYDFIEREKKYCSHDECPKPTCEAVQMRTPRSEKLSSAEYFIANVPDRKSLTAEVFLYVDGGEQEKTLKIRTNQDVDDDVFTN